MTMTQWLQQYVQDLVTQPDAVSLTVNEGVMTKTVTIKVAPQDVALFAGRNNRLPRAMNTVAGLAGSKAPRTRYVLKFSA